MPLPDAALPYGFVNEPVGTHTSRTIMVSELGMLLSAAAPDLDYTAIRALVIEDNVCGKATQSGRRELFRRLAELYSFRQDVPIYRVFRALWDAADGERPLLAMLLACARDPLLRCTAAPVLDAPQGARLTPQDLTDAIDAAYPGRYSRGIAASGGRHTIASWAQSGHLRGRAVKLRAQSSTGPAATAFALYLGWLCGARGLPLFETFWAQLLDADAGTVDHLAFAAAQRDWVDYRRIGDVVDLGFALFERIAEGRA